LQHGTDNKVDIYISILKMESNFSKYTVAELKDICSNIDQVRDPELYQKVMEELRIQESLQEKYTDSKVKRSIAPSVILILVVICIFYEKIPGRHGGLTPEEDPFFFWGTLVVISGMCLNRLLSTKAIKKKNGVGDT